MTESTITLERVRELRGHVGGSPLATAQEWDAILGLAEGKLGKPATEGITLERIREMREGNVLGVGFSYTIEEMFALLSAAERGLEADAEREAWADRKQALETCMRDCAEADKRIAELEQEKGRLAREAVAFDDHGRALQSRLAEARARIAELTQRIDEQEEEKAADQRCIKRWMEAHENRKLELAALQARIAADAITITGSKGVIAGLTNERDEAEAVAKRWQAEHDKIFQAFRDLAESCAKTTALSFELKASRDVWQHIAGEEQGKRSKIEAERDRLRARLQDWIIKTGGYCPLCGNIDCHATTCLLAEAAPPAAPAEDWRNFPSGRKRCPACRGTGDIADALPCPTCDGEGYVPAEAPAQPPRADAELSPEETAVRDVRAVFDKHEPALRAAIDSVLVQPPRADEGMQTPFGSVIAVEFTPQLSVASAIARDFVASFKMLDRATERNVEAWLTRRIVADIAAAEARAKKAEAEAYDLAGQVFDLQGRLRTAESDALAEHNWRRQDRIRARDAEARARTEGYNAGAKDVHAKRDEEIRIARAKMLEECIKAVKQTAWDDLGDDDDLYSRGQYRGASYQLDAAIAVIRALGPPPEQADAPTECPHCSGTGEIEHAKFGFARCSPCNGSGEIRATTEGNGNG